MLSNNPEYYIGGFSFLGIIAVAMRLLWKLQSSGEAIYERRSDRQNETITRLDASITALRKDTEACHKERVVLSATVAQQTELITALQTQVESLTRQVTLNSIHVATNTVDISNNATQAASDSANILVNTKEIAVNTKDIADNTHKSEGE